MSKFKIKKKGMTKKDNALELDKCIKLKIEEMRGNFRIER